MASSENGSRSSGADCIRRTVRGSRPFLQSSTSTLSKSASVGAWVEMITDSGSSCAAVAVSRASYSGLRGPLTWPNSSCATNRGLKPNAVAASADNARYSVPKSGQAICFAVSRMTRTECKSAFIRIIFAASANKTLAWSRLWAAENNCELGFASGPHRNRSINIAVSTVLAFFRPRVIMARRVPAGLSKIARKSSFMNSAILSG